MNKSKFVILASVFFVSLICCSVSAQQRQIISGLVIDKYELKDGSITVQYPEKLSSGKRISGTVIVQPQSEKPSKKTKQLENLQKHILMFGKNIPVKDGIFVVDLPEGKNLPIGILSENGAKIGEQFAQLTEPIVGEKLKIPSTIKANSIEMIEGDFLGDVSKANLTLDKNPVEIIAGNENQLFYKVENVDPGKLKLNLDYGDQNQVQEINLIDYTLSIDKTILNRGEKAHLKAKVFGLQEVTDEVKLSVQNITLGTVLLEGGQEQSILVDPREINESGIWEKDFEITSIKKGTFTLNTDLIIFDEAEINQADSLAEMIDFKEPIEIENPENKTNTKKNEQRGTENTDPDLINTPARNRPNPTEMLPEPKPRKHCIKFPFDPNIDDRLGWDLFGSLYSNGQIDSDYLNDLRGGSIKQKLNQANRLSGSLQTILNENYFKAYQCNEYLAHADVAQEFPQFPWEDIFLTVDLCDEATEGKTSLIDFLDPDADMDAIKKWREDFEKAVQNFGIPESASGYDNMLGSFSANTAKAMSEISKAYDEFQEDMRVTLALRYNASRARSRMWEAVAFTVGTALSVVTGGGSAALAAVFVSTSGFVLEQGMTSMGMDENIAQLVTAIATAGIGATDVIIASSTTTVAEGLNTLSQNNVESYAMSMALLDDDVWAKMIENLSEDYRIDAINQFNAHRNKFIGAVKEQLAELCKIKNSLVKLLPETEKAIDEAKLWVSSTFWRQLWNERMDDTLDCCCEYSDGSGPHQSCKQTIPPLGFDPHEFLRMQEQRKK